MAQSIYLNMIPNTPTPRVYLSQYDVGETIDFILFYDSIEYTPPVGATVKVQGTKPSGFGYTVTATTDDNVASIEITEDMTGEAGNVISELVVTESGNIIGSKNFIIEIEKSPHPNGIIDGNAEEVIPELTQLVERVEDAASSVLDRQTVTNTLPAGSQASYSFDEETNTQTFGIPQGEAGAGAVDVTASAYSSSKTYAVGDYVIHNDYLYRCTTAITTAEAWTSGHWTQVVLGDDVSDLKSDLSKDQSGWEIAFLWQGGHKAIYTNVNEGDTVDTAPITTTGDFSCVLLDCNADDTFRISGVGSTSYNVWAFLDTNKKLIKKSRNQEYDRKIITAPADAKYLVINSKESGICCKGVVEKDYISNLIDDHDKIGQWSSYNQHIAITDNVADIDHPNYRESELIRYNVIECNEGDLYTVCLNASSNIAPIIITDADKYVIWSSSTRSASISNKTYIMPKGAAYLILHTIGEGYCYKERPHIEANKIEQKYVGRNGIAPVWELGKYINSDGDIDSSITYALSDEIYVTGDNIGITFIDINTSRNANAVAYMHAYDDLGNWIYRQAFMYGGVLVKRTIMLPKNCATVRLVIGYTTGSTFTIPMLSDFCFEWATKEISKDFVNIFSTQEINIYEHYKIMPPQGGRVQSDEHWCTGFIKVAAGEKYYHKDVVKVSYFTVNSSMEKIYSHDDYSNISGIFIIPENIEYIRLTYEYHNVQIGDALFAYIYNNDNTDIIESIIATQNELENRPNSYGLANCIARVNQISKITYTPVEDLPNYSGDISAGTECVGLPYSSVKAYDKYIGINLSLYTFLTAIQNPKSVLYTRRAKSEGPNGELIIAKTYYGFACSSVVNYAYDIDAPLRNTFSLANYVTGIDKRQSIYAIQQGDIGTIIDDGGGHTIFIKGLERDKFGRIRRVRIIEAVPPNVLERSLSFSSFASSFSYFEFYHYHYVDGISYEQSPYIMGYEDEIVENLPNIDIMPEFGDRACIEANQNVTINIIDSTGYSSIAIYKDDILLETKSVIDDFTIQSIASGLYKFVMTGEDKEAESYLNVVDVSGSYNSETGIVTFESQRATPIAVNIYDVIGRTKVVVPLSDDDIENGYINVSEYVDGEYPYVKVFFGTEYGTAVWRSQELNLWEYIDL